VNRYPPNSGCSQNFFIGQIHASTLGRHVTGVALIAVNGMIAENIRTLADAI
jgi:hypothetical protein